MNMTHQILQTVRLVCSFKAFRRELDAIERLPQEQANEFPGRQYQQAG